MSHDCHTHLAHDASQRDALHTNACASSLWVILHYMGKAIPREDSNNDTLQYLLVYYIAVHTTTLQNDGLANQRQEVSFTHANIH